MTRRPWAHLYLQFNTNDAIGMQQSLADAGRAGWEVVGITGVDRTLSFNAVIAILKRPGAERAAPENAGTAAWHPDPWGRHHQRYWNAMYWTHHIIDHAGVQSTDVPGDD